MNLIEIRGVPRLLRLLTLHPVFSATGEGGATALHCAAGTDRADLTSLLLDHGAAVDSLDQERNTPLHWAARRLSMATARLLVERGADVKKPGKDSWTALRECEDV